MINVPTSIKICVDSLINELTLLSHNKCQHFNCSQFVHNIVVLTVNLNSTTNMTFSNKTFKHVTHVIFDMDGLLLDTESLYAQAFKNILKKYNKTFKKEYQMEVMGTNTDVVSKYFVDTLQLPMSYQEFTAAKEVEMTLLLPSCIFMPDTEIHYRKAISLIAQSFNKMYTPKIMGKVVGTPETETCRIAIREMNLPLEIEQFRNIFVKLAHNNMNNVPLLTGYFL
ncbi:hypothetical protein WA026_021855 [Henosepilachna vigintioctopunctata]|uniref:Uncharacterized protein n=1 Tax=Henosepilachna vigintioctopunctata TaxID=420089 RepID=A0AAW1UMU2_9CUCU